MGQGKLVVYDPTEGPRGGEFKWAHREGSLAGRTVGLLDNGKMNSDKLLSAIGDLLREQEVKAVRMVRKPFPYRPADPEQLDELARSADLAVTGIGD